MALVSPLKVSERKRKSHSGLPALGSPGGNGAALSLIDEYFGDERAQGRACGPSGTGEGEGDELAAARHMIERQQRELLALAAQCERRREEVAELKKALREKNTVEKDMCDDGAISFGGIETCFVEVVVVETEVPSAEEGELRRRLAAVSAKKAELEERALELDTVRMQKDETAAQLRSMKAERDSLSQDLAKLTVQLAESRQLASAAGSATDAAEAERLRGAVGRLEAEAAEERRYRDRLEVKLAALERDLQGWEAKERELQRLRMIMRYSVLKKDSDELTVAKQRVIELEALLERSRGERPSAEMERLRGVEKAYHDLKEKIRSGGLGEVAVESRTHSIDARSSQQQRELCSLPNARPTTAKSRATIGGSVLLPAALPSAATGATTPRGTDHIRHNRRRIQSAAPNMEQRLRGSGKH